LTACKSPLIIVLGGGAHGHQSAYRHGFGNPSSSSKQRLAGIPDIRHNMSLLALRVENEINSHGVSCVVFSPFMFVTLRNNIIEDFPVDIIKRTLKTGTAVIIHGDVCFDENKSASILSGDTIAVYLAKKLVAKAVFIGTNVDGLLEEDPQYNPSAQYIPFIDRSNMNQVLIHTGPSSSTDVTGGMNKKIIELLGLPNRNVDIAIFNLTVPGRLTHLLTKKPTICTRIQIT
jgi:isopentenyl phosphate kinase